MKSYINILLRYMMDLAIPSMRVRNIPIDGKMTKLKIEDVIIKDSNKTDEPTIFVANHSNMHDLPTVAQYNKNKFAIVAAKTSSLSNVTKMAFKIFDVIWVFREKKGGGGFSSI